MDTQNKKENLSLEIPMIQYDVPWKYHYKNEYFFQTDPLLINAPLNVIWKIATDINNYHKLSGDAITAHLVQKEFKVNNTITFKLYKKTALSILIPSSVEKINLIDLNKKVFGWERRLPLGDITERYQILEPIKDGKQTISFIVLKIPSWIGFFVSLILKKPIEEAFRKLNEGIKKEAEK